MLPNLARLVVPLSFAFLFLPDPSATAQANQPQIPITISENLIYVTVHINGRGPYRFMLDSGVSGIGRIDYRVAKALQLNIVGYQENSDVYHVRREILVAVDKLSLGPITHSGLKLVAADCNTTPRQIPVDGILGRDFFQDYLLTIDGPARRLTISRDQLDAHTPGVLSYQKPFLVMGKVGQTNLYVNLDTGSTYAFQFPAYSLAGIHYTDTPNKQIVTTTNATFTAQEAILTDSLVLGAVTVTTQKIYYSDKTNQINVGMDFLKQHTITIDQRRKRVRID